jgi:glycosyltransferase involved in cell wall biosynthesis
MVANPDWSKHTGATPVPPTKPARLKFEQPTFTVTFDAVKISIVIPAFNEERLIGESLAQIKSAARAFAKIGWETELIVCDNNSTDRTAEISRAAGAIVVFEPINQIARARNSGAAAATGDWLVFVDADSHPSAELFSDVAEQINSGKCLAGGATIRLDEKYFVAGLITRVWNCVSRSFKLLAGSFIFCNAAAFRKIGGFSSELFAGEELELSQRLKKLARGQGRAIVVLHRHPLVTSARKMKLYTAREHLRFLFYAIFNQRRTLRDREAAHLWYDGRR